VHKKVKESIDSIIGPQPLLSESKKRKILRELEHRSTVREHRLMKRSLPIVALIAIFFVATLLGMQVLNSGKDMAIDSKGEQETAFEDNARLDMAENREPNQIVKGDAGAQPLQSVNEPLSDDIEKLKIENEKLENRISLLESKLAHESPKIMYEPTESLLKESGFSGNAEDIIDQVAISDDLIPKTSILRDPVHFIKDRIFLISHKNIYAEFTDGIRNGYIILHYEVKNGEINNLKVLEYFVEEE